MTLAQISLLSDGERRFHDPKGSASSRADEGTLTDLAMLAGMRIG